MSGFARYPHPVPDPVPTDVPGQMRRILVGGITAAGKTTLARQLANRLGLPFVEMDGLYHGPAWTPAPTFVDDVERVTAGSIWVLDSHGYAAVRELCWSRADTVVWLDYPRWLVMARVLRRTARRLLTRERLWNDNREPPPWTVFTDPEHILRWAWTQHAPRRRLIGRLAADPAYAHLRVVRLRRPRDTRAWLAAVTR